MNTALAIAAAWLTYVNPFTLQVRSEDGWLWLGTVFAASAAGVAYAIWSITAGDRRAWMRAFEAATHEALESASADSS